MQSTESGGEYDSPNDRSTASLTSSYSHKTTRPQAAISPCDVDDVFKAVLERMNGRVGYLTSRDIDVDGLTPTQTGSALAELASTPECPVLFELWGGTASPKRYRIVLPEGVDA